MYKEFWRLNFLTLAQYRANFWVWLAFTLVLHGSAVMTIWLTMHRFPIMHGWTWQQVFFLYTLYMLAHTLNNTLFFSVGDVGEHIREGKFDRFLVRPLDPLFQVLSQPGQIWPDDLAVAIVFFSASQWLVHLHWTPWTALLLLGAMTGGALIDFAIQLAVATIAFWVIRLEALRWVVMSLENDFTRYPISIYNRIVRFTLSFVFPFAFMNYFPASTLLQQHAGAELQINPIFGWLTPIVGLVWFCGAYLFWRRGLDHYQGTGS